MKNYSYPIDLSWSTEELTTVLHFFNQVETAYESKVDSQKILAAYKAFKMVVKSKGQERQIDREFEAVSGYSTYQVVKAAKETERGVISLGR
jgi:uncharacterized protein YktA (UPF0223 family)